MDSGHQLCFAADLTGTVVIFNKQFKDIDSINVTPTKAIEPLTIIYDFCRYSKSYKFQSFSV